MSSKSPVRCAMYTGLKSVLDSESLDVAANAMRQNGVATLPVVGADGTPKGLLHRDDLEQAEGTTAGDVCRDWIAVEADETLDGALAVLRRERVGRLPVVSHGQVVGGITQFQIRDYMRYEDEFEREYGLRLDALNREISPGDTM